MSTSYSAYAMWQMIGATRWVWLFLLTAAVGCSCGDDKDGEVRLRTDGGDASGNVGTACTTSGECGAGLICAGEVCQVNEGPCVSDDDCDGDTYCCADGCAPSGEAGACIAYGLDPRGDTNPACVGDSLIGVFSPSVQCEWAGPSSDDPYPEHRNVLATPLVANLGNTPSTAAGTVEPTEILVVSYNFDDGGDESARGINPAYFGVIRILNGQTCELMESIAEPQGVNNMIASANPAVGDLDGDGVPEIVTLRANTGLIAWRWNAQANRHERYWVATQSDIADRRRWDGVSLHDIDGDAFPEVLSMYEVYDGRTGARRNPGNVLAGFNRNGAFSIVDDVDDDGAPELVAGPVYAWNAQQSQWVVEHTGAPTGGAFAVADFGTPGVPFDPSTLDGIAEIVRVEAGVVSLTTLDGTQVLSAAIPGGGSGGPPTVGDFDNDGFPEIATAGAQNYAVFDLDCAEATLAGCAGLYLRWTQTSQDMSSNVTGSSIFDFEGDGRAEAVYGDECFTRIYDGLSGEVLYSAYRTSCTWYENPVVADPDRDQNTEILIGSNDNCAIECPEIDPIHRGTRCEEDADCVSSSCNEGFCRCTANNECSAGNHCATPLAGTPGAGNTCRAYHPPDEGQSGVRVLRDRLDRWVSSRPMWNQHAYSITNINDDGTVPSSTQRRRNAAQEGMNNFRQNIQGAAGQGEVPDITGKLTDGVCVETTGEATKLVSTVCNRGLRAVGASLPATFYVGDPGNGNVLCTSYTSGAVPVGGCLEVSCELTEDVVNQNIVVVVNDDGQGGAITVECNDENNTDAVFLEACRILR